MAQKIDFAIGGQAVIEGVMMRSPNFVTVAVQKKDGSIKVKVTQFTSLVKRVKLFKLPLIRGVVNLCEMMVVGLNALNFSAEEYAEDFETEEEKAASKKAREASQKKNITTIVSMGLSLVLSLAIGLFFFKFIPLLITEQLRAYFPFIANNYVVFNLIDGTIRIAIFIGYIGALSLFPSFRRIFEYHGAEHMSIHAYEQNLELTPHNIKPFSPRHPRCGTSFLMAVFIVSIVVYSIVPRNPIFWLNLVQRIAMLPLIAGIGYEILKWSAKHVKHPIVKLVTIPGIATQYITTKTPDEAQIKVAIASLKKALESEVEFASR